MRLRGLPTAILACLAIASSCDRHREPEPAPAARAARETDRAELRARMHGRFEGVDLARSALARGDLDAARTIATTIQLEAPLDMPPALRARGDRVADRARDLASAEELDAATAAFARLLATCGECHRAAFEELGDVAGSAPQPPLPQPPLPQPAMTEPPMPVGDDLEARMQQHAWATERMWEALIVASPERFERAAAALEVAARSLELAPRAAEPADLRALEERLRDAAHRARTATTLEARAEAYGEILGTCGRCHDAIRDLPAVPRSTGDPGR